MDNEPADNSMNLKRSWSVVLWLSRFLNQAEREAVLGDLTECGENGRRAIASVLGLVAWRQTAALRDLRLWFVVAVVVLPVSYMLSAIAQTTAGEGAVYSWMYLNNWHWTLTRNPGFWYLLRDTAMTFGVTCVVLACWSWSGGFLIGRFPNPMLRVSRYAFIVLLSVSFVFDARDFLIHFWTFLHGLPLRPLLPDYNAPITANVFYQVFFPWIVLVITVILPAFSGMQQGNRSLLPERKTRIVLIIAATISVLILLTQVPGFDLLLSVAVREWLRRHKSVTQLLPLLCCWPIVYFVVVGFVDHQQRKAAMAR